MPSRNPPIETERTVSLKNVWSSWTFFDHGGNWIWSKEDTLRQRDGKTCRVVLTGRSKTGTKRLFQNRTTQSFEATMDLSDARMEKVIRIRKAIANGSYNVSSANLAQKLIDTMLRDFR